jgi:hypothetical protein
MSLTRRLLILAFGLVVLGLPITVGVTTITPVQVVYMPFAFVVFYGLVDLVFVYLKKKLKDNEGFFFMGILIFKFLALSVVAMVLGKKQIAQNHSLVFLFLVCYLAFLALYAWHMASFLSEKDK